MSTIIVVVVSLFVQALALKVAVGAMGAQKGTNTYVTALGVALGLNLSWFVLQFVPLFGWLVYAILWFGVIMGVYKIGFLRSLGAAFLAVMIRLLIGLIFWLVGLGPALS